MTRPPPSPAAEGSPQDEGASREIMYTAVVGAPEVRSPHEVLRKGLLHLGADIGWPFGHLWVRDPVLPDTLISSGLFHQENPERFEAFRWVTESSCFRRGAALPGLVFRAGEPIWLSDLAGIDDFRRRDAAREAGLRTAFAFPIRVDGEVVAVLEFFTTEKHEPDHALLDTMERKGADLGRLVERAWAGQGVGASDSSDFHHAMLAEFPFLVWRGGSDGSRSYFNRAWLDFTGRSRAEEIGQGWLEGVDPDDRGRVERACAAAAREARPLTIDYRLRRRDGATRWVNDVARPFRNGRGEFLGHIGSCYDVTMRYGLVAELRDNRERLRLLSRRFLDMQEEAHRRIARGLHDDIAQLLAAVRMDLQSIGGAEGSNRGTEGREESGDVARAMDMLDRCIQSIRTLALDLRPPDLDDLGLVPAVRSYLDRQTRASKIPIHLTAEDAHAAVPVDVETASFRIIQEAVTNAVRHADPRSIHVAIRRVPEALELRVLDDGRGFDPQSPGCSTGAGLVGMEERVALLDGELKVASTPGGGTEILARFPLSGASSE